MPFGAASKNEVLDFFYFFHRLNARGKEFAEGGFGEDLFDLKAFEFGAFIVFEEALFDNEKLVSCAAVNVHVCLFKNQIQFCIDFIFEDH